MSVKLRHRKKGNKIHLYLDTYHQGLRKTESLQIQLHYNPNKSALTKEQRLDNKDKLRLAEEICAQRNLALITNQYNLADVNKQKASFIKYLESLAEKRKESKGNYDNWDSMLKHLKRHQPNDISIGQVNKEWVEGFKDYLRNKAKTPSMQPLAANSLCSYFNKLRAGLKQAVRDGIITKNPAEYIDGFQPSDPVREYLTREELEELVKHDCEIPILKQAFLFSCFTGLRWSDVQKLSWKEIRNDNNLGLHIRYSQQKTKSFEVLPINDLAAKFLPKKSEDENERVFVGLKYSAWHNLRLQQWVGKAGIYKTITFHCARHTYATLLLANKTDIYTVQKMLGHKHISTTAIYTKVMDIHKREASDRINFDFALSN
jgi:integrase